MTRLPGLPRQRRGGKGQIRRAGLVGARTVVIGGGGFEVGDYHLVHRPRLALDQAAVLLVKSVFEAGAPGLQALPDQRACRMKSPAATLPVELPS